MIVHGDCLEVMAGLEPESVASVVTDPPYGLGFMGKAWDGTAGPGGLGDVPMRRRAETNKVNTGVSRQGGRQRSTDDFAKRQARDARSFQAWCETWAAAAFRVAKPGAHLLSFGGTRTYHRLASAIEDAGWEVRDCLVWGYASGFPKSSNPGRGNDAFLCRSFGNHTDDPEHVCPRMSPDEWYGLGTALKPAWEPIIMARKTPRGTVVANLKAHGTGAINIDGTRIGTAAMPPIPGELGANGIYGRMAREPSRAGEASADRRYPDEPGDFAALPGPRGGDPAGRWPANVILTDPIFDGGIAGVIGGGYTSSGQMPAGPLTGGKDDTTILGAFDGGLTARDVPGDSGTYSRFFLIPKADRAEREPIAGGLTMGRVSSKPDGRQWDIPGSHSKDRRNVHPTVKPVDLMRHLIRLVTPPGGIVLDPFLGSGTTGIAAEMEGFDWIGIEQEAEYVAIAQARLEGVQRGFGLSA